MILIKCNIVWAVNARNKCTCIGPDTVKLNMANVNTRQGRFFLSLKMRHFIHYPCRGEETYIAITFPGRIRCSLNSQQPYLVGVDWIYESIGGIAVGVHIPKALTQRSQFGDHVFGGKNLKLQFYWCIPIGRESRPFCLHVLCLWALYK